MLWKDCNHLKK